MLRLTLLLAALAPFAAQAAGDLTVLPQGRYGCWTSGSASGPAVNADPERDFTIVRGSSYASVGGGGTYLLAGDMLTFTRGPFKDTRFQRRDGFWQQVARDGGLERLKCHRIGPALASESSEGIDPSRPNSPSGLSEPDRD